MLSLLYAYDPLSQLSSSPTDLEIRGLEPEPRNREAGALLKIQTEPDPHIYETAPFPTYC